MCEWVGLYVRIYGTHYVWYEAKLVNVGCVGGLVDSCVGGCVQ